MLRCPRSAHSTHRYCDQVAESSSRTRLLQLRWAGILLLIQGILMEGIVVIALVVTLILEVPQRVVTEQTDVFALPYLNDNLYLMMAMSGVFAALRITGAIGVMRNRLWALALSLVNCVVTIALMIFLLPAGLADGVFSGLALVLMLSAWLGRNVDGSVRTVVSG